MTIDVPRRRVVLAWLAALLLAGCGDASRPATTRSSAVGVFAAAPTDRSLYAGFLVVDGVYNTELTAPYDIFQHTVFHTDPAPGIEVFTVSPDGGAVTSFEGLRLEADHGFDDHPPIDILVVPSAEGSIGRDLDNRAMIDWVRRVGAGARYVVSLCDGAFVLAEAGLLDGRACTTFPGDQDAFEARYGALDLRREVSFVHDGPALTSAGGAQSFDVALHLVAVLYGDDVATGVGRGLILDWPAPSHVRSIVVREAG